MIEYLVLFLSLFFLSVGYFLQNRRISELVLPSDITTTESNASPSLTSKKQFGSILPSHFSAFGWVLLGMYWLSQIPQYLDIEDYINALLCGAAFPFFSFIAYKEITLIGIGGSKWTEGSDGLRFLSGITIITLTGYTIISSIPIVEGSLEYINAYIVSAFLTATGFNAEAGAMDLSGNSPWYRNNDLIISAPIFHDGHDEILITLSCTAFSSILLFSAAIFSAREPLRTKSKAFMLTIPVIFVLNIIRMAMISYLTYTEMTSPEFAHHILGRIGSLISLLFLAWVLLTFLPSLATSMEDAYSTIFGREHGSGKKKNGIWRQVEEKIR